MIKAIIFDLGGVLFTNGTATFIKSLSVKYNMSIETVQNIIGNGTIGTAYREGKIDRNEFWKKALDALQIHADIDRLEDEWIDGYTLISETRDIIRDLSQRYKVYYLSDNVRERVQRLNARHKFIE